jgi:hypothetical protein
MMTAFIKYPVGLNERQERYAGLHEPDQNLPLESEKYCRINAAFPAAAGLAMDVPTVGIE